MDFLVLIIFFIILIRNFFEMKFDFIQFLIIFHIDIIFFISKL